MIFTSTIQTEKTPSPRTTLIRLSVRLQEMGKVLNAQRELLAQRDIDLPSEAVDHVMRLAREVQSFAELAPDNAYELQRLRELARTSNIINSQLRLDQVLNDVIDTVIALTGAERGFVMLRAEAGETFRWEIRAARGINQNDLSEEDAIVSQTVVDKVATSGEALLSVNAQEDPRFDTSASVYQYLMRSLLCVPLKFKDRLIGVIYVDNRAMHGLFTERDQQLVTLFALQAAIAIENARLFDEVRSALAEITAIRDFMDNVFDSIASGVITADQQDRVMLINESAARILALSEQVTGASLWQVLPPLYEGFDALLASVRQQNRQEIIEVEPVLQERGQVNLNLRLSPFQDSARVTQGVAIVVDDLTQSKQQEATISAVRRYLPAVDNITALEDLALSGVERDISVMFCDVRGFTAFSETLSPEEVMMIINRYMAVSTHAVEAEGGIIDKFLGDAVVGLFNTQLNPMEDHAMRAVRAAVKMLRNVQSLHAELPPESRLLYGVGVHTGLAVLGNVGSPSRKEFTAIGHTLDFAKMLQDLAPGGEVVISRDLLTRVKDFVTVERANPRRTLTDGEFGVELYRVISLRE